MMKQLIYGIVLVFVFCAGWISNSSFNIPQNSRQEELNELNRKRIVSPVKTITSQEKNTIDLFENCAPSVAFITTKGLEQDYWTRKVYEVPAGTGSGFIWDKLGHIVTNFHVVNGGQKWEVTLGDQTVWNAALIGAEPRKDLAILKIDVPEDKLVPIPVGSSHDLKVGQSVYAIGNPFGLDQTLTTGIISALGREIESLARIPIRDVIQTDAAINPGNSGGPLLDSSGRLIGVNTAIYSPSGASVGIGFSIPVDIVNWVVPDLILFGEVKRPILGIELVPQQYMDRWKITGAMIKAVSPNSAAEKAGLLPTNQNRSGAVRFGDIVLKINQKAILSNNDLILTLENYQPSDTVILNILRDEVELEIPVILGSSM